MAENARNISSASSFRIFGALISRHFDASIAALRSSIFYLIQISVSSFHIFGAFSNFISQHFNASIATLRSSISYLIRMRFVNSFNEITALTIFILLGFAQLKFQGNDQSSFATHPRAMRIAVFSSIIYFLAYIALLRFPLPRFAAVVAPYCLVLSSYASVASLVSVLLPDSVSRFVYAIFALLSACELLLSLYQKLVAEEDDAEFRRRFRRIFNNIFRVERNSSYRRRFRGLLNYIFEVEGNSSGQWPQIVPPV